MVYYSTMEWITADHHFGHTRIIELAYRPFKTVDEMDDTMIELWNKDVKPNDLVWYAGDFAMCGATKAHAYFERLNGQIHILPGNHDRWINKNLPKNVTICPLIKVLKRRMLKIAVCHYPLLEWPGFFRGGLHFHGHCHGNELPWTHPRMKDIGVDTNNYRLYNLEELVNGYIGTT